MDPHEVLGVRAGAGPREVTEAYRRYALRHHPDRGGDETAFAAGAEAYRRLTGRAGAAAPGRRADVVFHRRRRRPALASLLRLARWQRRVPPRPLV